MVSVWQTLTRTPSSYKKKHMGKSRTAIKLSFHQLHMWRQCARTSLHNHITVILVLRPVVYEPGFISKLQSEDKVAWPLHPFQLSSPKQLQQPTMHVWVLTVYACFKGARNYLIFIKCACSPGCYGTYLLKYSTYKQAVCCSVVSTWSAKHMRRLRAPIYPQARPRAGQIKTYILTKHHGVTYFPEMLYLGLLAREKFSNMALSWLK